MKDLIKFSTMSLLVASMLIACGGGSSSKDPGNTPPPGGGSSTPPGGGGNNDSTIRGKAVDGYLNQSIVCLDLSLDGYCQVASEPTANTDASGSYSLTLTDAHKSHANFDKAPILVYDGFDTSSNKRFTGKLQAPNDGEAINVTPMTTILHKTVEKYSIDSNLTKAEIKTKIEASKIKLKRIFNLADNIDLGDDPIVLKASDDSLIKASLSLQKSIETMVKAKKTDSKKSETDLTEDIFEALVYGFEDINVSADNLSLDLLLDKTAENHTSKALLGEKAVKVKDTAKKVASKIKKLYEESAGKDYDVQTIIDRDIISMQKEFDSHDWTKEDFNTSVELDLDENSSVFKDDYNPRIDALEYELKYLGFIGISRDSILAALSSDIKANSFYDEDTYNTFKDNDKLKSLYDRIIKEITKWENEKDANEDEAKKLSNDTLAFNIPNTYYSVYKDRYNNRVSYEYSKTDLQDGIFKTEQFKYENRSWISDNNENNDDKDDTDLRLVNGKWISEDANNIFTISEDKKTLSFTNYGVLTKNFEDEIEGETYIKDIEKAVDFPSGSKEYGFKFTKTEDEYSAYNVERNYHNGSEEIITSFSQIINNNCSNGWFIGDENGGLTFAGTRENNNSSYVCDGNARSGLMVEVSRSKEGYNRVRDENAGTWSIEDVDGNEILVIRANDVSKYSHGDDIEHTIFAKITNENNETAIYRGNLREKGGEDRIVVYNETAIEAIKASIASITADKVLGEIYGHEFKVSYGNEKYSNGTSSYDSKSETIHLRTNKIDNKDSRSQIITYNEEDSGFTEIKVGVHYYDIGYKGKFQVFLGTSRNLKSSSIIGDLESTTNLTMHTGINLYKNSISVWVNVEDKNGDQYSYSEGMPILSDELNKKIAEQKVVVSIQVVGKNINYDVFKEDGITKIGNTLTLAMPSEIIGNVIFDHTHIRTRIDDRKSGENKTDVTSAIIYGFTSDGSTPVNDDYEVATGSQEVPDS